MNARPPVQRLTGHVVVDTDLGTLLGDTRVRLREAIGEHGSISQAARHVPMSYKAAWDAVDAMNNLTDQPLVQRCTGGRAGGGTRLTDHGQRTIALYRAVEAEHQAALDRLASRIAELPVGDVPSCQHLLRRLAVRSSGRNQFWGTVRRIVDGPVNAEVTLDLGHDRSATAVITQESMLSLQLAVGVRACAAFKVSSVILSVID